MKSGRVYHQNKSSNVSNFYLTKKKSHWRENCLRQHVELTITKPHQILRNNAQKILQRSINCAIAAQQNCVNLVRQIVSVQLIIGHSYVY